ncbi:unnamed protein product, partial [Polarella glacialis]
ASSGSRGGKRIKQKTTPAERMQVVGMLGVVMLLALAVISVGLYADVTRVREAWSSSVFGSVISSMSPAGGEVLDHAAGQFSPSFRGSVRADAVPPSGVNATTAGGEATALPGRDAN